MTEASPVRPVPSREWLALIAAVVVGLVLRVWEAAESSLWLDELHTLAHASLPSASAVAENVGREYHSPLFFVFVHWFGAWEQGAWLRAIPVVSSLLVFLPLIALARTSSASSRTTMLAAWLFACLPYAVHWSQELRPYAWMMVFSAGAAWSAFSERGSKRSRFLLFALCVLCGIWTHRLMALAVFSIGFARLFVRRPAMLHLGWLIAAGVLAVAPSLPWLLDFAQRGTEMRLEFHASTGGYRVRRTLVLQCLQLPTRVFVPYMGSLGGAWGTLATLSALGFFAAAGLAALAWCVRRWRRTIGSSAPLSALALFAATYFVLVTVCAFWIWDRFPLQYYAPIAWALPVLVAEVSNAVPDAVRRWLAGALAVSALALGVAQAGGSCTEDLRRAVATARELGGALDRPMYTAIVSQPSLFEQVIPYRAYGRDLDVVVHEQLPAPGEPGSERPLIVIRRGSIALTSEDWQPLLAGRRVAQEVSIDRALTVFVLERADS